MSDARAYERDGQMSSKSYLHMPPPVPEAFPGVPEAVKKLLTKVEGGGGGLTLSANDVLEIREYTLITPLMGGGAASGSWDPVTTIRAPQIRGMLRYWWRATQCGRFSSLEAMALEESKIWGSAARSSSSGKKHFPHPSDVSGPSHVQIIAYEPRRIARTSAIHGMSEQGTTLYDGSNIKQEWRDIAYAAFPLQGGKGKPAGQVKEHIRFTLMISYPEIYKNDIQSALWAWETFGGMGARTRRGFGALKLEKVNGEKATLPKVEDVEKWLREKFDAYVVSCPEGKSCVCTQGVPHLDKTMIEEPYRLFLDKNVRGVGKNQPKQVQGYDNAKLAWGVLITSLKDFRQWRTKKKSKWPEKAMIDYLIKKRTNHRASKPSVPKFPRAAFGLPIVFEFKGDKHRVPPSSTLRGSKIERLASPLILKPLACAGDSYIGLACILSGTSIMHLPGHGGLQLTFSRPVGERQKVSALLTDDEAKLLDPLVLDPRSKARLQPEKNVLQAFIRYLNNRLRQ